LELNISTQTWLYTVRHGQTDIGYNDTVEASSRLKTIGISFDIVITSSLQRAIKTAEILVKNTPIVQCALCDERNYGKMQSLTVDEVALLKPKVVYITVGGDTHSTNPPEGETFKILRERAEQFHTWIFERYQGLKILIVSHGVFLQQFHGLLLGNSQVDSLKINVNNLVLTRFLFEGTQLVSHETINLSNSTQTNW
jgi:broad specificity phosphatase PhoE